MAAAADLKWCTCLKFRFFGGEGFPYGIFEHPSLWQSWGIYIVLKYISEERKKNNWEICLLWKNLFFRWITSCVQGWEDALLKRPLENTKKDILQYTKQEEKKGKIYYNIYISYKKKFNKRHYITIFKTEKNILQYTT